MSRAWEKLVPHLREMVDLASAIKLMSWDQATLMPPNASPARARSMATVESMAHQYLISPEVGDLLQELSSDDSLDEDQAASIRILKRDYDRATKVPPALVHELAELSGTAYQAWTEARPQSDFSVLQPHLEKMIRLKKEEADAIGWETERYDALLDEYEPEMTTRDVEAMFNELTEGLRPLLEKIVGVSSPRAEFLSNSYDPSSQEVFSHWLVGVLNFDSTSGRLDTSPHPFTITIGAGDVRQTTRSEENDLMMSIYATIHETGHALYEQGLPTELLDLPVGRTPSLGMHESQSRLWENLVGRSRPFTEFMLPHLKERFPAQLGMVSPDEFYRAANHVEPTLIRVTADEVTYNLHLMLRFELELAMFREELDVADLPNAWDAAMEKHLGVRPDSDANGVLQDMHWSTGIQGYFPTYTLGTIYSAAFFAKAQEQLGNLDDDLREGDTSRLLGWLRENIHSKAYRYPAKELAEQVLGAPVSAKPLLEHLRTKYSELYDITP
ncbi:MAG: carboxypeptidase Taq [Actinomycetota bacterium]|jgi:carboxypeptidase Taq|nr:carboxypeptidase Taq [Actinomycetota bacterium]